MLYRMIFKCPRCGQTYRHVAEVRLLAPPDCNRGHETQTMRLIEANEYESDQVAISTDRVRVGVSRHARSRVTRVGVVDPAKVKTTPKRGPLRVGSSRSEVPSG